MCLVRIGQELMAETVIGLDIGSFAVRAAELRFDSSGVSLRRFAQIVLPPGAVTGGEITDRALVVTALRRLWSGGQFSSRKVVVGLSSQKVIVRQADLVSMTDDDLRSAIKYEAQEFLPIPVDDAYLDCQVVERPAIKPDDDTARSMRILLAASQRAAVDVPLAVLASAGLEPVAVDVVALALLRTVPPLPPEPENKKTVEAVVCIGAELTVITVREGVHTRFVRVLPTGGASLTTAMSVELSVDMDRAEHYKRRSGTDQGVPAAASFTATTVLADQIDPLVDEICGSLDFYRAQARVGSIDRLSITGGSVNARGLVDRLSEVAGIEAEVVDPLSWVKLDCKSLTGDQLDKAKPYMSVAVGLALWGAPGLDRQISLLPREAGEARRRRRAVLAFGAALAVVVAVLGFSWEVRQHSLNNQDKIAATTQADVSLLQAKVAHLGTAVGLKAKVKAAAAQLDSALEGDVDWVRLIGQIAAVMPANVLITGLTTTGPQPASASGAAQAGTLTFSAVSSDGRPSVAAWITDLESLPALSNVWVPSQASGDGSVTPTQSTTFQSSATLTDRAGSNRAQQIIKGAPLTRKMVAAFVAIIVGVAAVWYLALWSPQSKKLDATRQQVVSAQQSQAQLVAQAVALKGQQKFAPALQAALGRIDTALPASPDLAGTISDVNSAASSAGVSIQNFTVQQDSGTTIAAPAGLTEVPVDMTAAGSYYQLMNFIYYLQHLPRLVKVTGLSFTPSSGGGQYSCDVSSTVFYRGHNDSVGAA